MKLLSSVCLAGVLFVGLACRPSGRVAEQTDEPGPTPLADPLQVVARDMFSRLKEGMTEAEVEAILGKEGSKWVEKGGRYKGLPVKHWMLPGKNEIMVGFKDGKVLIKILNLFQLKSARPPVPPPPLSPQKR